MSADALVCPRCWEAYARHKATQIKCRRCRLHVCHLCAGMMNLCIYCQHDISDTTGRCAGGGKCACKGASVCTYVCKRCNDTDVNERLTNFVKSKFSVDLEALRTRMEKELQEERVAGRCNLEAVPDIDLCSNEDDDELPPTASAGEESREATPEAPAEAAAPSPKRQRAAAPAVE